MLRSGLLLALAITLTSGAVAQTPAVQPLATPTQKVKSPPPSTFERLGTPTYGTVVTVGEKEKVSSDAASSIHSGGYGTVHEAEWSPLDGPWGPHFFFAPFWWGPPRLHCWFDCQFFGGCWPPLWSPYGWGWDPWYDGYGWSPYGMYPGYSQNPWFSPIAPHRLTFQLSQVHPSGLVRPLPLNRPDPPTGKGKLRPGEPRQDGIVPRPPVRPPTSSRGGGNLGGGARPGTNPVVRPSPPRPSPSPRPRPR